MNALATALLAELDDDALDALAQRLTPFVAARIGDNGHGAWLDAAGAAEYLCCPVSRIYALVSADKAAGGRIPHHRDGSRLLFRRDELDAWVRAGGAKRP